jgi:hypothetical protein
MTGTPILYASGQNYNRGAGARITFPDQRWLKFPVRGTERANAIITAVDQAGTRLPDTGTKTYRTGWGMRSPSIPVSS